jgi:quercetin dioxygenase-like cupin family protein
MRKLHFVSAVLGILCVSLVCPAQQTPAKPASMAKPAAAEKSASMATPKMIMVVPADLKYAPLPAWAVSGKPSVENTGTLEVAVLAGNPEKAWPYTVRAHCTDGYKIAPHWHPTAENVTVLQGQLSVGMGAKWDSNGLKAMQTGSFASVPASVRHFAQCDGDTVLQIHGQGPLKINFVSTMPAVRPMKKTPAKASGQ